MTNLTNYSEAYEEWDDGEWQECPDCYGSGLDRDELYDCRTCFGEGEIPVVFDVGISVTVDTAAG
jgi:hypothetical protein